MGVYRSWPVIHDEGDGTFSVFYGRGVQHVVTDTTRDIVSVRGNFSQGWTSEQAVVDYPVEDDSTFGVGVDSSGRLLMWVRRVVTGPVFAHEVWRRDAGVWSVISTPTFSPEPIVVMNICDVDGTLVAGWHSGADETDNSYGVLLSDDDGVTWSQVTIGALVLEDNWPIEMNLLHVGAGDVIGLARTQDSAQNQWHVTASGDLTVPANWTFAQSNIDDILAQPVGMVVHDGVIDAYYWDRENYGGNGIGHLRYRHGLVSELDTDPTAWSASELLALGVPGLDSGNVNVVRRDGRNVVVWYSGLVWGDDSPTIFGMEHA